MKSETIYVSTDAYKALNDISRKQRGCKPLTPEQYEKVFERMAYNRRMKDGLIRLDDMSMGGGDGTYTGTWTRWTVSDLKRNLAELGFGWEQGDTMRYMSAESPV